MPDEESLRALYESMHDEEVLELATKRDDLIDTAQRLLRAELKKRGITDSHVSRLAQHLRDVEIAERAEPIATRFNGCGTTLLGHRNEQPDGSYAVTRWATLFWIPLIPLREMRIKPVTLANGRKGYTILKEQKWKWGRPDAPSF